MHLRARAPSEPSWQGRRSGSGRTTHALMHTSSTPTSTPPINDQHNCKSKYYRQGLLHQAREHRGNIAGTTAKGPREHRGNVKIVSALLALEQARERALERSRERVPAQIVPAEGAARERSREQRCNVRAYTRERRGNIAGTSRERLGMGGTSEGVTCGGGSSVRH